MINSVFVDKHASKYKWWQRTNVITYTKVWIVRNTLQRNRWQHIVFVVPTYDQKKGYGVDAHTRHNSNIYTSK